MATCTHEIGTADTGNTPNTTGTFTPAAGDLLIVFCVGSVTVEGADVVSNSAGLTFTLVESAAYNATGNTVQVYVANQLATAVSQTCTWTPADTATGSNILVCAVAGMTRTGLSAIRQFAKQDNQGAGGTPAPAFSVAALTGNPTLGCVGNNSTAPIITEPTGWTEPAGGDISYATPTTGAAYCFRNSGFTGTTVTWGSTSASVFGSLIVELDASVPVAGSGFFNFF